MQYELHGEKAGEESEQVVKDRLWFAFVLDVESVGDESLIRSEEWRRP
jgi:hypothetical protein